MRYLKSQTNPSRMPELNLVPMMDVIMTILTFFIVVSMTLTTTQSVDLSLPSVADPAQQENAPPPAEPLIISMGRNGQTFLEGRLAPEEELNAAIVRYLQKSPKGVILLKADQKLPYEKVVQVLTRLRRVGGERVSLAIETI